MSATDELRALAADFGRASRQVASDLYDAYKDEGEEFAQEWASNATATAGRHGKHYPASIDSETRVALGIVVEIGPNTAKKQGGMGPGFELGSANQPAHLDGLRAMPAAEARLTAAATAAIAALLP